jgi:hypothetical protein
MPIRISSQNVTMTQLIDLFEMLKDNNIEYDLIIETKDKEGSKRTGS